MPVDRRLVLRVRKVRRRILVLGERRIRVGGTTVGSTAAHAAAHAAHSTGCRSGRAVSMLLPVREHGRDQPEHQRRAGNRREEGGC